MACTTTPTADETDAAARDSGMARDSRVLDSATTTSRCEEIGPLGATLAGQFGTFGGTSTTVYNTLWRRVGTSDVVGFEGYGTNTSLIGVNADLASTVNKSYATCTHCILFYRNCTFSATATNCADGPYYQSAGTGSFNLFTETSGGSFGGSFSNVTLERVTINDTTGATALVAGGSCLRASSISLAGIATASSSSSGGTESGLRQTAAGVSYYNTCTTMAECTGTPKCLSVTGKTGRICSQACTGDADCPVSGICVKYGTVGNCMKPCPSGGCGGTQTCHSYLRLSNSSTVQVCAPMDW